jgi:hypothetical protein
MENREFQTRLTLIKLIENLNEKNNDFRLNKSYQKIKQE